MISRVQVVTVFVRDLEVSLPFYRDLLGFDLVADWRGEDGDRMLFLLPPGAETEIGLYAPGGDDPRIGMATGIVFTADDIRDTVGTLRGRGVHIEEPVVHDYGSGDRPGDTGDLECWFTDPDGNRFVLHS